MLGLSSDNEIPSVVLLDINMPDYDGFEILQKLRGMDRYDRVPIIVMATTSSSPQDREQSKNLGANAFWTKPNGIKGYIEFFRDLHS